MPKENNPKHTAKTTKGDVMIYKLYTYSVFHSLDETTSARKNSYNNMTSPICYFITMEDPEYVENLL